MTVEELDLARAKEAYYAATKNAHRPPTWEDAFPQVRKLWLSIVRTTRLGDEARGLRVVPVEATEVMLSRGHQQIDWSRSDHPTDDMNFQPSYGGTSCAQDMKDAWNAMLAAAPFAPEEKG